MLKPLLTWYTITSAKSLAIFLPKYCQGKLKNFEFASDFTTNVLSTWILKTVELPKQGELPYYRLQITYSNWVFSVRISSIWWFKHFISSRWDCLIIINIIPEDELKIRGRRLLNDLLMISIFSISILSSSFGFE